MQNADLSNMSLEDINNLDGITVGGEHVVSWLRHKTTDEKTRDIEKTRQQEICIHHGKHKPYPKQAKESGPKVSRRVVRLTDKQIRKEYGIMSKPYETLNENIIWCMVEKGPITNMEMIEELGFEKGTGAFSAIVTGIWHKLGDEGAQVIERTKKPGNLFYEYHKKPGIEMSVDAIIEQHTLWGKTAYKEEQLKKRRQAFLDSLTEQEREEELEKERQLKQSQEKKKIQVKEPVNGNGKSTDLEEQTIKNVAQQIGQTLGININLSGRVDVVFGISLDQNMN